MIWKPPLVFLPAQLVRILVTLLPAQLVRMLLAVLPAELVRILVALLPPQLVKMLLAVHQHQVCLQARLWMYVYQIVSVELFNAKYVVV